MRRLISFVTAVAIGFACSPSAALADEGMWTFDNFPSAKVRQAYGVSITPAFLDHLRKSAVRGVGCSASFISPDGLVMTNHHCVLGCVGDLDTPQNDLVQRGFLAQRREDERACPNYELNQLVSITDVTKTILAATAGKRGADANAALRAVTVSVQRSCGTDRAVRCQVVSLYHGGVYDLYRYKRYDDVRLAFAPEYSVAQFGGDPDNFNFPRFDFDIGILRAYENGKPAASPDYLRWSADGSKAGDVVFVAGNPGRTSRELTVSQLAYARDFALPESLAQLAESRGILEQFEERGPEQRRETSERLFGIENSYKAQTGRRLALVDPAFFASKVRAEKRLRAAVDARPALRADASAWTEIERLQRLMQSLGHRQDAVAAATRGPLGTALSLVRAATERVKPDTERLPEFTDQALVRLGPSLEAKTPFYPDLERVQLAFRLAKLRESLGTDDALVKTFLGNASPDQVADRLITGSKIGDPAFRKALYEGGKDAVAASTDPIIAFARTIDPQLRALRKENEDRIEAPARAAAERIAKARFAVYGTTIDPDATFTLRLSYGTVKGFATLAGAQVPPFTTIAGLFARATGAEPYALPASWLAAKTSLNLATPMNLSTTNDIIGGNSGSPLIDTRGEIVGLIFDGNIFSLGGDYGYDPARNRAIAVDSRALLEGLAKVYHADYLVAEINAARRR